MKSNYILKKDLPNCPKGRIFKPTHDGEIYFLSITEDECISGKIHEYKFKSTEVESNPYWFKKEKESDLKNQLLLAEKTKKDLEYQISELKKKLKIK